MQPEGVARRAHEHERQRVIGARVRRERSRDAFVAGEFHISTEQRIGEPQNRIEPVDRQQQEAQRLGDEIAAANVRALVRDGAGGGLFIDIRRQVDARAKQAEHEGGGKAGDFIYVFGDFPGVLHAQTQANGGKQQVNDQRGGARKPYAGGDLSGRDARGDHRCGLPDVSGRCGWNGGRQVERR